MTQIDRCSIRKIYVYVWLILSEPAAATNRIHSRQKRICAAFVTDRCVWSVAGKNFNFITQRQNFVEERIHQLLGRAAGQVGSTNRSGEQTVANERLHLSGFEQNDVARCVCGTMNHSEPQFAYFIGLAVAPMFIYFRWFVIIKAVCRPL